MDDYNQIEDFINAFINNGNSCDGKGGWANDFRSTKLKFA
jgi:hypothetical protein